MTAENFVPSKAETQESSGDFLMEDVLNQDDFQKQLEALYREKQELLRRKLVADKFSETARKKLEDIDEQIAIMKQFIGSEEINTLKPVEVFDDLTHKRFDNAAFPGQVKGKVILSAEKIEELKEKELEEEKEKREAQQPLTPAQQAAQPKQPARPNDPQQPQKPIETPEQKTERIRQQLSQRDPRKQQDALEELKKPENKDLAKDDPVFQKLKKNAEKRVERFKKVRLSLRKNLKTLMQSDSEVVKKNMDELRAGRIGSGLAGMKEIGKSTDARFNDVAKACKGLFENVEELYKEFDIQPKEALSREAMNDAKPLFTRQMGFKSKEDREIDRNSRQNKFMGQSNELSEEERHTYKIKLRDMYGVNVDQLPAIDAETHKDMRIIREIIKEDAQAAHNEVRNPAALMAATVRGSR